jgi:hypothetical protein
MLYKGALSAKPKPYNIKWRRCIPYSIMRGNIKQNKIGHYEGRFTQSVQNTSTNVRQ